MTGPYLLTVHKVQDTGLHQVETTGPCDRTLASTFTNLTGDAEREIAGFHARHIRVLTALDGGKF